MKVMKDCNLLSCQHRCKLYLSKEIVVVSNLALLGTDQASLDVFDEFVDVRGCDDALDLFQTDQEQCKLVQQASVVDFLVAIADHDLAECVEQRLARAISGEKDGLDRSFRQRIDCLLLHRIFEASEREF